MLFFLINHFTYEVWQFLGLNGVNKYYLQSKLM